MGEAGTEPSPRQRIEALLVDRRQPWGPVVTERLARFCLEVIDTQQSEQHAIAVRLCSLCREDAPLNATISPAYFAAGKWTHEVVWKGGGTSWPLCHAIEVYAARPRKLEHERGLWEAINGSTS